MPKKELSNPRLTIWKAILSGLYLWAVFTLLGWFFTFTWEPGRYSGFNSNPPSFPPLNILPGSLWVPIFLWLYWAWKPRRKHARWHRWLAAVIVNVYLSVLLLSAAVNTWNTLLSHPWNLVVNGILVLLVILAWILPALSYRWSKKIADAQDILGLRMLAFGGPATLMVAAGMLGASLGMSASRKGNIGVVLIAAFGLSLVAVFVPQYSIQHLWFYRPWAKEDE